MGFYTENQKEIIRELYQQNNNYAWLQKKIYETLGLYLSRRQVKYVIESRKKLIGGKVDTEHPRYAELCNALLRYKRVINKTPTIREYKSFAGVSSGVIEQVFGSYNQMLDYCLKLVGIDYESSQVAAKDAQRELKKDKIISQFVAFVRENKYVPNLSEFHRKCGVPNTTFRMYFGGFEEFLAEAKNSHPQVFNSLNNESRFSEEAFVELCKKTSESRRFFITTAVTGCKVSEPALKSINTYCQENNAMLLVLPCTDPAKNTESKYKMRVDSTIPFENVVFSDLNLNDSLMLSTIKLSAKQINPLTGLKRLGNKGSVILASPKQMLEHVANSNKKEIPRAVMTTGAITLPDYRTDMYMSERTAYLANEDHTLGGVVVEIVDHKHFFYRRVQINGDGSFFDLDKKYDGKKVIPSVAKVINMGDWHTGCTDPDVRRCSVEICNTMHPKWITFEDFFDGRSVNPHEASHIANRNMQYRDTGLTLEKELQACSEEIQYFLDNTDALLVFKYGNHEDFLKRWLKKAEYATDPVNHYIGVVLAKAYLEGNEPFEYAMRNLYPVSQPDRITFLSVNDSFVVDGIENAVHGHIGASGKRNPTMAGLEAYGAVTVGHNHSAGIFRDVVRVGTSTKLQLSYNDGASAWTQTLCIQHQDSSRQLVTMINGQWRRYN